MLVFILGVRFAWLTHERNEDYRTARAIWLDTVQKRPGNARAHNNFGQILFEQKKTAEAESHYQTAVRLDPEYADAYCNLGTLYISQRKIDIARSHLQEALRIDPNFAIAHNNMGALLADHFGQYDQAVFHYQQAIKLNFLEPGVFCNLGIALTRLGRYDEAVFNLEESLRLNPDFQIANDELRKLKKFLDDNKRG